MPSIQVLDRNFDIFIQEDKILNRVKTLAESINQDYAGKPVVFVAVLNGSFMLASDLMKQIELECRIEFIKASSYTGTQSTGNIKELIGLKGDIAGHHVLIIEDIIDTGLTIDYIINSLKEKNPESIEVCSLLLKPEALQVDLKPKYIGFEVENKFLLGYGLDYDGFGRNLKHIYIEKC
jgi:hypoxanthine phosphoribosyltransferase